MASVRQDPEVDLLVLAKEPAPGRAKTRLSPPCTATEAAAIAEAALADTLAAAMSSRADRVVVVLDGQPGEWCPPGVVVVGQGEGDLAARLAAAWQSTAGPALQIGMDTPQVTARDLDAAMAHLDGGHVDAVLGLAEDGGWWAIGLGRPCPGVFEGIATSRGDTGERQARRLADLGLRAARLPTLRDVDTWDDATTVAGLAPGGRFECAVCAVARRVGR